MQPAFHRTRMAPVFTACPKKICGTFSFVRKKSVRILVLIIPLILTAEIRIRYN
jgi:hypothetical protein